MTRYLQMMVALVLLAGVAASAAEPTVPLFEGLGTTGRKVTTSSAEAQRYFDQGLCFLFAFNHDEAIRSFHRATSSIQIARWLGGGSRSPMDRISTSPCCHRSATSRPGSYHQGSEGRRQRNRQ